MSTDTASQSEDFSGSLRQSVIRFLHCLKLNVTIQWRNGFYAAGLFMCVVFSVVIYWIDSSLVADWLPVILFGNVQFSTFFFMAALVLMDKDEGIVHAQAVSPLSATMYLAAKALTLAVLITAECMVIVLASGISLDVITLLWVILTVVIASYLYCLIGFLCVYRYPNINRFIMPAMWMTFVAGLPIFEYLGLWSSVLFYLHPLQAALYAIGEAFGDTRIYVSWQEPLVLALVLSFTLILLHMLSNRAYRHWLRL